MPSLREWLFALCWAVGAGCSWVLFTYLRDFVMWHLEQLIAACVLIPARTNRSHKED